MMNTLSTFVLLTSIAFLAGGEAAVRADAGVPAPIPSDQPSAAQKAQIARKYGMFCHFGMNTYTDVEWGNGKTPAGTFAPPAGFEEKIEGWVKTAHDAGMRYFLCITKHHDGFCLWDSKVTDYCTSNPEIKNHVDVVKAVAAACRKYNVAFAVYYSLWDRHEPSYSNPKAYKEFMLKQLTELMSNYGPVCELWLDGSWDRPAKDWYLDEVYATVKRLQPDCQISSNWTIGAPDNINATVHPAQQKDGYPIRYFPSDFRLGDPDLPVTPDPKHFVHDGKSYYMPFESTVTVSAQNHWFAHPSDQKAKSAAQLEDFFYIATAQDNLLVLNIPPDKEGNLIPAQVASVMELAKRLNLGPGRQFPKAPVNLAIGATATASAIWSDPNDKNDYSAARAIDGNPGTRWASAKDTAAATLEVDFGKAVEFDRVVISEYAERVKSFAVEVWNGSKWSEVATGTDLGERKELRFPVAKASKVRLNIKQATDAPSIWEFKVLKPE
jgi:alpha-L-fucosidase